MIKIINDSSQRWERFLQIQNIELNSREQLSRTSNAINDNKIKTFIQDVNTRWDSTYDMLKRALKMRSIIDIWLIENEVKFRILRLSSQEWKQIQHIIDLLKSFQQITEFLSSISESFIHKTWVVYNVMHAHLKTQKRAVTNDISRAWTAQLRDAIDAAIESLIKYYDATIDKEETYFNLRICLNSCVKLNFYSVRSLSYLVLLNDCLSDHVLCCSFYCSLYFSYRYQHSFISNYLLIR